MALEKVSYNTFASFKASQSLTNTRVLFLNPQWHKVKDKCNKQKLLLENKELSDVG